MIHVNSFLLVLIFPVFVYAEKLESLTKSDEGSKDPSYSVDSIEEDTFDDLAETHDQISEEIVKYAQQIDLYFANERFVYRRNNSYIRFVNAVIFAETRGIKNEFDFKLRLRLPFLKEKLQFEFDSEAQEYNLKDPQRPAFVQNTRRSGRSNSGLSYLEKIFDFETKFTAGADYNHGFIPYGQIRIYRDFKLDKDHNISFRHDLYGETDDGYEQTGVISYEWRLMPDLFLRFINEERYEFKTHVFETLHGPNLYHQINDRHAMAYSFLVRSKNNQTGHAFYADQYILGTVYRYRAYKKHLYFEIGPGLVFPKDNHFEGLMTFLIKLDVIFGNL